MYKSCSMVVCKLVLLDAAIFSGGWIFCCHDSWRQHDVVMTWSVLVSTQHSPFSTCQGDMRGLRTDSCTHGLRSTDSRLWRLNRPTNCESKIMHHAVFAATVVSLPLAKQDNRVYIFWVFKLAADLACMGHHTDMEGIEVAIFRRAPKTLSLKDLKLTDHTKINSWKIQ